MKSFKKTRIYRFCRWGLLSSWGYVSLNDCINIKKLWLFWNIFPYTQQNYSGLLNIYELSETVEIRKISGCFVECGVWRGGCAAIMAMVAEKARSGRALWLFDSFEGMPEATVMDVGEEAWELSRGKIDGRLLPVGTNVASLDDVERLFYDKLQLKGENIFFVKGWFQETLVNYKSIVGPISILRIDGDWYESTKVCLENLYDNVVEGGYVIIDDYGWFPGCKKAVDEFFEEKGLRPKLIKVDFTRVYFQKKTSNE
jgi:hypothetical protein